MRLGSMGAVALRAALGRVPLRDRETWAKSAMPGMGVPGAGAFACGRTDCPHPTHWSGVHLAAAALALLPEDVDVPEAPVSLEDPEPGAPDTDAPESLPAATGIGSGTSRRAPVSGSASGDVLIALGRDLAIGKRDRARLDRVRARLRDHGKRDRSAPVALPPTTLPPLTCPDGYAPERVMPEWTPGPLDAPLDWLLRERMHTLLTGPAGTGKTEGFRQACARAGLPCVVIPCHAGMGYHDLIGSVGAENGATRWDDGAFTRCVRAGVVPVLDEVGALKASAAAAIHDAIASGRLLLPLNGGEVLTLGTMIGATSNSIGTDVPQAHEGEVSNPMLDRFVVLQTCYGTEDEEAALLARALGIRLGGKRVSASTVPLKAFALDGSHLRLIAGYQADLNAAVGDGRISKPMTRRGARYLARLWAAWGGTGEGFLLALQGSVMDRLAPSESAAALDIAKRRFPAEVISPVEGPAS